MPVSPISVLQYIYIMYFQDNNDRWTCDQTLRADAQLRKVNMFNPYDAGLCVYKPWRPKGFSQIETILNVLVISFRFILIPMLWVYGHYNCFNSFSAGTSLHARVWRPQTSESDVHRRHILTSVDSPAHWEGWIVFTLWHATRMKRYASSYFKTDQSNRLVSFNPNFYTSTISIFIIAILTHVLYWIRYHVDGYHY